MIFISYPRLQSFLDNLDDAEPVPGMIIFGTDGVWVDDVPDPGH